MSVTIVEPYHPCRHTVPLMEQIRKVHIATIVVIQILPVWIFPEIPKQAQSHWETLLHGGDELGTKEGDRLTLGTIIHLGDTCRPILSEMLTHPL